MGTLIILEAMELTSPNLDLPMLYGYALGERISCHDGVCCYPASRRDTEQQYILKVISIPASSSKLDALLLSGALADKKAARAYFKQLAKDLLQQAQLLQELSLQEGFISYLDCDMCPMEDGVGFYVCLLGTQKKALDRILSSDSLTHADILHMGLDLCAALAAARRAGMLYADLKPSNIFYEPEQGCRIGDVGFIALPSLNYTCLPDKYRSSYTAPELYDDYAVLNPTVDVFSLGMVLYQAYNGGVLPFEGAAPAGELPAPLYADYEMAQILAKACHAEPSQRWQDPSQLAQALMGYMQQFGAPETPIIPPSVEIEEEAEEVEEFLPEAAPEELLAEMALLEEEEADVLILPEESIAEESESLEAPTDGEATEAPVAALLDEDPVDLDSILAQADELIAHEVPLGVQISETEPAEEMPQEPQPPEEETQEDTPLPLIPDDATAVETDDVRTEKESKMPRRVVKWAVIAALLLILAVGLFFGGKYFYEQVYTLHVQSMELENTLETLTVKVFTDGDEGLLRVVCSDSYGRNQESAVVNGIARFEGLHPSTRYTVRILANGKHRVTGHTTDSFTTPEQITILSFLATVGPEDCSVILNFTFDGPEPGGWIVRYSAEGIEEQAQVFTGRSTTIYGLENGADYHFTLEPQAQMHITGITQVTHQATNILYAKDLQILSCGNGSLSVQWQQPDNGTANAWIVRCYNDDGYDVTVTTEECSYTFTELTHDSPCTVEVKAVGMNRSVATRISANPITILNFACTVTDEMALLVTWDHIGPTPDSWLIAVSIDGSEPIQLSTEKNELLLMPLPGSTYAFGFIAAPGSDILQDQHSYTTEEMTFFEGFGINAAELGCLLCLQPNEDVQDWSAYLHENYRIAFTYGEAAAVLLQTNAQIVDAEDAVLVQFVINNANGQPLHMNSASMIWNGMWQDGYCCLALPYLPEVRGDYILTLYFDGQFVADLEFTVA